MLEGQRVYEGVASRPRRFWGQPATVIYVKPRAPQMTLVPTKTKVLVKEDDGMLRWETEDSLTVVAEEEYPYEVWADYSSGEKWRYRWDSESWELRIEGHAPDCLLPWSVDKQTWHITAYYMMQTRILSNYPVDDKPHLRGPPSWFKPIDLNARDAKGFGIKSEYALQLGIVRPQPHVLFKRPPWVDPASVQEESP